jgi:heme exporter protein A
VASSPLVRFVDAGFATSGSVILQHVDLAIHRGEVIGVTGPNGAGKTTLLRLLATLHRPSHGTYSVLGATRDTSPDDLAAIRRNIALVGHSPAVWPELTLRENVELVARLRGRPDTDESLRRVGLDGVAGLKAAHTSLGMQRRVEFARLLTWTPRLLLLDEPHAGLDTATTALVDEVVNRVAGGRGAAVLVSHDPERIADLVTRRLVVKAGTVSEDDR